MYTVHVQSVSVKHSSRIAKVVLGLAAPDSSNMEEVDNIIIHTFRQVGCDIDEDVVSLRQFSTELIIEATVRCLKIIDDSTSLPLALPPGMSARFRMGTDLANALVSLGYKGEMGYQTFLYSNEADIRRVLMFLVEKLPKDTAVTSDEPLGKSALLNRSIAASILIKLQTPWLPPCCKKRGIRWRTPKQWNREGASGTHLFHSIVVTVPSGLDDLSRKIPKEVKSYYSKDLPLVSQQPSRHEDTAASLLETNAAEVTAAQEWEAEWNSAGLQSRLTPQEYKARKKERLQKKIASQLQQDVQKAEAGGATTVGAADLLQFLSNFSDRTPSKQQGKGSRFTHTSKLQFAQDDDKAISQMGIGEGVPKADTEEELRQKREEEQQGLRDQLTQLTNQMDVLELDMKKFTAGIQQMEEQKNLEERQNAEKEDTYKVKKRTMDLLPDAENNIAKLQGVVESSAQRLVSLAKQWEKHRAPLIEEYRKLKEQNANKESESLKKLEDIQALRDRMKEVVDETRGKEELHKQLVSEYERMTKDVNRSAYTRRILEIVANIKKQKQEIQKVLVDTKTLQKEINHMSGKLDRTFTVTDELIFKDAKKDESVRKAYKYLAALHENFDQLIKTVEETGSIVREIRDLEDQIETESNKKTIANLEKITADYKEMKKENTVLMVKVKGK
ncbi:LOW QUALITY PROTEIN: coiled-coil domain-containing protein 22 homolog [Acanthaster planci]|uniref:LOW QUALITY PROTEIN: coiled-coil domain-containing protein 22 homolog n=1 Tax=Acanthaster planci TaxID=133434 RepID=A0A8B7Y1N8_ACAPL|nr:LOW QUALITY PROTEIN: coiled-coil domain-containing protein 22 homolog [Acanthaster planci]